MNDFKWTQRKWFLFNFIIIMISNKFFMLCKIHWKLCARVVNFYLTRKCHNRTEKMRKEKLVYCIVFHQTATHKNKILPLKEESLQHKTFFSCFKKNYCAQKIKQVKKSLLIMRSVNVMHVFFFLLLFVGAKVKMPGEFLQ